MWVISQRRGKEMLEKKLLFEEKFNNISLIIV